MRYDQYNEKFTTFFYNLYAIVYVLYILSLLVDLIYLKFLNYIFDNSMMVKKVEVGIRVFNYKHTYIYNIY